MNQTTNNEGDELKIIVPVRKIPDHQLILREQLASAEKDGKTYSISLTLNGFIIIETSDAKYSIALRDILIGIIDKVHIEHE